jgi:FtsH-binding integral membrane protein
MAVTLQGLAIRLSTIVALATFFAFSVLMGVSLAPIIWHFTSGSVAVTFFASSGTFGIAALWGSVTRRELSGRAVSLLIGLVGLLVASLANALAFGLHGSFLRWLTTYGGVVAFTGLAAYDAQRIKRAVRAIGPEAPARRAIQGATMLYLDFISLFVYLLRILGRRRDWQSPAALTSRGQPSMAD